MEWPQMHRRVDFCGVYSNRENMENLPVLDFFLIKDKILKFYGS